MTPHRQTVLLVATNPNPKTTKLPQTLSGSPIRWTTATTPIDARKIALVSHPAHIIFELPNPADLHHFKELCAGSALADIPITTSQD